MQKEKVTKVLEKHVKLFQGKRGEWKGAEVSLKLKQNANACLALPCHCYHRKGSSLKRVRPTRGNLNHTIIKSKGSIRNRMGTPNYRNNKKEQGRDAFSMVFSTIEPYFGTKSISYRASARFGDVRRKIRLGECIWFENGVSHDALVSRKK